jgi:hypothetical protein
MERKSFNLSFAVRSRELNCFCFQSQLTDLPTGLPTLEDLGVTPASVPEKMPWELEYYRAFKFHRYWHFAQRPAIHPLVPITRLEEKQIEDKKAIAKGLLHSIGLNYN